MPLWCARGGLLKIGLGCLGTQLSRRGDVFNRFGLLGKAFWAVLEPSWPVLERSWAALGTDPRRQGTALDDKNLHKGAQASRRGDAECSVR